MTWSKVSGWIEVAHRWQQEDLDCPLPSAMARTAELDPFCLIPNDHPARCPRGLVDRPIIWPSNI